MDFPQDYTPEKEALRPIWREAFLAALADTGNVRAACEAAGVDRRTPYKSREGDPEFAQQWDEALASASDLLVLEARRRAYAGVREPVIHQGQVAGMWIDADGNAVPPNTPGSRLMPLTITKYSDTLLIFLIKGTRPEYRDSNKVVVAGDPSAPVKHEHTVTLTSRLDQLAAAFAGAADREETSGPSGDGPGESVHP